MKKWYRAGLTKALLVIMAHIMIMVVTVNLMRIISYPVFREEIFEGSKAKTYEDTMNFSQAFMTDSFQVVWGIQQAHIYETDGKINLDKVVDIEEYYNHTTVSGENNSGLAYRMQDLIDWYEKDAHRDDDETEEEHLRNSVIVCKKVDNTYQYYRYGELETLINTGELSFVLGKNDSGWEEDEILDSLRYGQFSEGESAEVNFKGLQDKEGRVVYIDCWSYDGYEEPYPQGTFAPLGYDSLLQLVNENPDWNGRLSEAVKMVTSVMCNIGDNFDKYINVNSGIEEGNTNYSYVYADLKNKRVFTNKSAYTSLEDLEKNIEEIKSFGKYVVVKPDLEDFESNIKNAEASGWRDEIAKSGPQEEDFVFAASVNTEYPVQDMYYIENQLFQKYGSNASEILGFAIAAGILFLACVIWLTVVAGRRPEDEEVHLNGFDRWKTEIAAILVFGIWLAVMLLVGFSVIDTFSSAGYYTESNYHSTDYVSASVPYIIVAAVLVTFSCAMFLIGFLSLVRRIKAKTMWKNSLLRTICRFVKKVFNNLPNLWQMILLFGGFVAVHWFTFIMARVMYPVEIIFLFLLLVEGGAFVFLVLQTLGKNKIKEGIKRIAGGELHYKIPTDKLIGDQKEIAESINRIGEGLDAAVEKSMKSERLKTDLITNVSHDIKTPLTSIINYVDLLKQENFDDPKVQRYIEVLEQKAQRLKTLTEDVVEASKVSSGNITLECMNINLVEMIQQTSGEFEEKFAARGLKEVLSLPEEEALIYVDGRRTWRILENIYNNAAKYAMPGSRIYGDLTVMPGAVVFSLKNVSEQPLNISADELTERFIRGDISRSTEGSGLGLSIAKTLTEMQKGTFELYLDGDLFKVTIAFPRVK